MLKHQFTMRVLQSNTVHGNQASSDVKSGRRTLDAELTHKTLDHDAPDAGSGGGAQDAAG